MRRYTLDNDPIDFADFLAVNVDAFTDDEIRRICALAPGESILLGGGAAASFTLTRLADAPAEDDLRAENTRLVHALERSHKTYESQAEEIARLKRELAEAQVALAAARKAGVA